VQVASQASAVGAGGLHPDPIDRAEAAQPTGELPIASCGRREGGPAEATTHAVQRNRVVSLGVAVDPADDNVRGYGHPDRAAPFLDGRRAGRDGRTRQ
jgi:hypothetical protein